MVLVFCVDTDATMSSRTTAGITLLDLAKSAIEHATNATRNEQHLLVTTADGSDGLKVTWGNSVASFDWQFKTLTTAAVAGNSDGGDGGSGGRGIGGGIAAGLAHAFTLLHQRRLLTGVDHWGRGFAPWLSEPAAVILLTGAAELAGNGGEGDGGSGEDAIAALTAAVAARCGVAATALCEQPWRWDHRLFVLVLAPRPPPPAA
ncbi:unnamed protein product, partial [Phaeothamnion confervicola]